MPSEKVMSLAEAVGRRFDSIFGREDSTPDTPPLEEPPVTPTSKESASVADSPIRDLQSIVLSIEWEITDSLLQRFEDEVVSLMDRYQTDPVKVHFLKVLQALGKYIKNKKAEAHPGSIKLMATTFKYFETVIFDNEMRLLDKQKLLQKTVQEFQQLKQAIAAKALEVSQLAKSEAPVKVQESLIETPMPATPRQGSEIPTPETQAPMPEPVNAQEPLTEAPQPVITPEPETTTPEAEISVPEPVRVQEPLTE
ncbi:MAG: hypothetical protein HQK55_11330, partial [Deltaproteobacteria bacterium]|nr:hypothetical protein [Deltaproteobacteria bacterium]